MLTGSGIGAMAVPAAAVERPASQRPAYSRERSEIGITERKSALISDASEEAGRDR